MRSKALVLLEETRLRLKNIVKKGRDWRERERAQTILLLSEGLSGRAVAERQGIIPGSVYERRQRWLDQGFAGLRDGRRCGAPPKLSETQVMSLRGWAEAEALTAPVMAARLKEQFGVAVHRNTVIGVLKKAGCVWKRTRHSLKKTG